MTQKPGDSKLKWLVPPRNADGRFPLRWRMPSWMTLSFFNMISKMWSKISYVQTHNLEFLQSALESRQGRPLITVSNHASCIDDPLIWGVLKWRHLLNTELMRWDPGAEDVISKWPLTNRLCSWGKVVPIRRGDGVFQHTMNFLVDELNRGNWVHVFPEGKINVTKEPMRLKWGVGRLIAECKIDPLVIPIWHLGADDVLPNRKPYFPPRILKELTIYVGKPLEFKTLLDQLKTAKKSPMEIRKAITDVIQEEFLELKAKAEHLHNSRKMISKS
ncbi:tafazzin-like [Lingula anatina]|uniref:Tafazzin family protein n=1 Tax=Lingula anatina TaxID=7574 RepID=A0A1S3IAP4_LINAN|nr:tafazzin-like [Lingula anatina]|eukprot:XP_013395332.1 tafazzin-like [Lingula anatina]